MAFNQALIEHEFSFDVTKNFPKDVYWQPKSTYIPTLSYQLQTSNAMWPHIIPNLIFVSIIMNLDKNIYACT